MAKFKGNVIMKNVRGMIGKQVVVKERLGTEYMCAKPVYDDNRPVSVAEQANRDRFAQTTEFAVAATKDPELKKEYAALTKKKGHNAYITAKLDASHPPKIVSVIHQGYTGVIGNVIIVQATDNVKVKCVKVGIYDSSNQIIEQGEAVDHGDGLNWMYTASVSNVNVNGCTIEVRAFDIAGNEAMSVVSY
jgi:hypothetical protein